jgi:hypothetical protein
VRIEIWEMFVTFLLLKLASLSRPAAPDMAMLVVERGITSHEASGGARVLAGAPRGANPLIPVSR